MPNGDHAGAASFLTRKIGPLPAWAYAAGAAAIVGVIALYQRGKGTAAGQAASAQASSPYASSLQGQLNYPPTVVVTPGGLTNTQPTATQQPSGSTASVSPSSNAQVAGVRFGETGQETGQGIWLDQGGTLKQVGQLPFGSGIQITGAAQQKQLPAPWNTPTTAYPIAGPSGQQLWIQAVDVGSWTPGSGGMGGGAITTRYPHGTAHLKLGHFVPFQPHQYVDGRGGGGPAGSAMHQVARRTGIPVIRLRSLNLHLRRPDGSYRPGIIRIA
jgi:hypothetical protein